MLVASTRIASVAEERLGQREPAVGAVVEGALQPLRRRGLGAVGLERDDEPREPADPLGAHRVPLVGHGAGADLLRLERLQQLALVLEQSQVARHLGRRLGDAAQRVEDRAVGLPRVGLAGHGERSREPELAVTRRSSSRTLSWSPSKSSRKEACVPVVPLQPRNRKRLEPVAELLDVEREVLHPERGALADRGELRRLEVGVGEAGDVRACAARSPPAPRAPR